jgi:hypothetical protein
MLAIVDLKKGQQTRVVGELSGLGKRLIDLSSYSSRAYALVYEETALGDAQYALIVIQLAPYDEPSILRKIIISELKEPKLLTCDRDYVAIAGFGHKDESLAVIYSSGQKNPRAAENASLSSIKLSEQPVCISLQDKSLVALVGSGGVGTKVDYISLQDPRVPQLRRTIDLQGQSKVLACVKNMFFTVGSGGSKDMFEARSYALDKEPSLQHTLGLPNTNFVADLVVQKNKLYLLGDSGFKLAMAEINIGKNGQLTNVEQVEVSSRQAKRGLETRLGLKDRQAYVVSGWAGVEVLHQEKKSWGYDSLYKVPRLPASSVAVSGHYAVVAGADLKLYDLSKKDKPKLITSAEIGASIKSVVAIGNFLLVLSANQLSLRRLTEPSYVIHNQKVQGQILTYDRLSKVAYVVSAQAEKSVVQSFKVYSDKVIAAESFEIQANIKNASAHGGYLALTALRELILYGTTNGFSEIGRRKMEKYAIRDVLCADDAVYLSVIDNELRGYLLSIAKDDSSLKQLAEIAVNNDACCLDMNSAARNIYVVGGERNGQHNIAIVSLSGPKSMHLMGNMPAIDGASSVIAGDSLVLVAGRGLQICAEN